jgi:HJR/Mrr/RecB family endonuclease
MVKKTQKAEIEKSQLESELKAEKELWENELIKTNNFFNSIINEHIKTLSLKRKQTVKKDDYGNVFDDKWLGEIEYFINNVLCKDERIKKMLSIKSEFENPELQNVLSDKEKIHYQIYIKQFPDRLELSKRIIDAVHEYDEQELKKHANGEIEHNNLDIENLSPIEFEHYCADILKAHGWQVRVTQASGDQGIDVIGKYNNKTVAFQCKKYSNPVGNKAVQEIIAGKQFINADMAAVVTNATYTESAKQLANATNVYLLHYSELKYFAEKITNYYQTK